MLLFWPAYSFFGIAVSLVSFAPGEKEGKVGVRKAGGPTVLPQGGRDTVQRQTPQAASLSLAQLRVPLRCKEAHACLRPKKPTIQGPQE